MSPRFVTTLPIFIGLCSGSSVIRSPTREYHVGLPFGPKKDHYRAGDECVLKCAPTASAESLRRDYDLVMGHGNTGSIFPAILEIFETVDSTCLVTAYVGPSLDEYRRSDGPMSYAQLTELGIELVRITASLHGSSGLNHRDATAHYFVSVSGLGGPFLITNVAAIRTLTQDPKGYHRIVEFQQVVMTIRYLIDLDDRFLRVKKLASKNIDFICPNDAACPHNLRNIIAFALSINAERGSVPDDLAETMRVGYWRYHHMDIIIEIPFVQSHSQKAMDCIIVGHVHRCRGAPKPKKLANMSRYTLTNPLRV
jgi:hypothetical protein